MAFSPLSAFSERFTLLRKTSKQERSMRPLSAALAPSREDVHPHNQRLRTRPGTTQRHVPVAYHATDQAILDLGGLEDANRPSRF